MKNQDYLINRADIYVGRVEKIDPKKIEIYKNGLYILEDDIKEEDIKDGFECQIHILEHRPALYYQGTEALRTMLFILDENNHANDLLYDVLNYPVLNISNNEDCLTSDIVITRCFKMNRILEYYQYPEQLDFDHINKLADFFFRNQDYILDNCELFGYRETAADQSGREIIDSHGKHRTFNEEFAGSILPHCYFNGFWSVPNNLIPKKQEDAIKLKK